MFIIIGGVLTNPTLDVVEVSGAYYIGFENRSAISIASTLFYLIASVWIVSTLIQSYRSAHSKKQKKMIIWLSLGLLMAVLMPSIQYIISPPAELQAENRAVFSMNMVIFREIIQSAGMVIIGFAFLKISKYPWLLQRQRTHLLIVYSNSGICLYNKAFDKDITDDDLLLLAGGFSAITSLFQEATKATGSVKSIAIEDRELRIINRTQFLCALLVDYSTRASELAHEKFALEFEKIFYNALEQFEGEITEFKKAEPIATKYFS